MRLLNRFTSSLPADPINTNAIRQVENAAYSFVQTQQMPNPKLILANHTLAESIGFSKNYLSSPIALKQLSGNTAFDGFNSYAMRYGGHQFGHWAGQLGDGRAINIAEIEHQGNVHTLQLKGSGLTPYSRMADGKAVLRSSIREYLCSEAMYSLGVPTTRALSLVTTGELVTRDIMYSGNPQDEIGAIVCRVSNSFIRFGNFQIAAAKNEIQLLQQLMDFTIENHYPEFHLENGYQYVDWFEEVVTRSIHMVVEWERVGFVHGVMNTDNMSILGETIDYGPYGWLDNYDENWTPNTTDNQHKRYRFGNQAQIVFWNCIQLANAIYPVVKDAKGLEEILNGFEQKYQLLHLNMMRKKLGLEKSFEEDSDLISSLKQLLQQSNVDYTMFFREISECEQSISELLGKISYQQQTKESIHKWEKFFSQYTMRIQQESLSSEERFSLMQQVNPRYIVRNYIAYLAISQAENGNYETLNELNEMLQSPYLKQEKFEKWYALRPDWALSTVGSSQLSCSS